MKRFALLALAPTLATALALPAAAARPTDDALALVPPDSVTAGMLRVADLRTSPLAARLFADFDRATVDGDAAKFLAETRLHPIDDVDLVVFAAQPGPHGQGPRRVRRALRAAAPRGGRRLARRRGPHGARRDLLPPEGQGAPRAQGRRRRRLRERPPPRRGVGRGRREGARRPGGRRHRVHGRSRPRRPARQGERERLRLAPRRPDEAPRGEGLADDLERRRGRRAQRDRRDEPRLDLHLRDDGEGRLHPALRRRLQRRRRHARAPRGRPPRNPGRGADRRRGEARGRLGHPEVQGRRATATP